uniref:Uncharacterized protein n=1 Tax=Morganella morganii TaxID=582 RepID=A0A514C8V7_MORMO|nr:hypothetical protein [Morganella morganii]
MHHFVMHSNHFYCYLTLVCVIFYVIYNLRNRSVRKLLLSY